MSSVAVVVLVGELWMVRAVLVLLAGVGLLVVYLLLTESVLWQKDPPASIARLQQPNLDADPGREDPVTPLRDDTIPREELLELLNAEVDLIQVGIEMGKLRRSGQKADVMKCVDLMHEHQPHAEALEARMATLPLKYAGLGAVANHTVRCVSCNPESADFNCQQAAQLIKEFGSDHGFRKATDG